MIKRIYLFIILGTLIENFYHVFEWLGYSDDFIYYTVFPTCQRIEIMLLPLWWILQKLFPVSIDDSKITWAYLIASTYFIFQLIDALDMALNANIRNASIDFVLFASLNISYWFVFRRKSI